MLADTMKQVQQTEQQAADILQDAKSKAAAILEIAKESAKQSKKDAESSAMEAAKAAMADAVQAGEAEKAAYAVGVNEQLEAAKQQALEKADAAVDAIIAGLV